MAKRKPPRSSIFLRWLAVGAILLVALLYARPLRSYLSTKRELANRIADVKSLEAQKRELKRRLIDYEGYKDGPLGLALSVAMCLYVAETYRQLWLLQRRARP